MKLPWNKNYLIISFHVVITLLMIYFLKYCVDAIAYILTNLDIISLSIKKGLSWFLSVFSVVIIAFVISYLLDPVVEFFQKKWISFKPKKEKNNTTKIFRKKLNKNNKVEDRMAGTLITYLIILGSILLITILLFAKISKTGENLVDSLTIFINKNIADFSLIYKKFENFLIEYGIFEQIYPYISKFINSITGFIGNIGNIFVEFISKFGNGIVNVLVSIVIAFYFLKDKKVIKEKCNNFGNTFLPNKVFNFTKDCLGDIHAVFSGYIRGQLLDASIMAILISIGLSLIGVKFSVIIGVISGFSNIIPYFGALIGFIFAISVSLLTGEPMKAIYSTVVMLVLQQIDTIFIVPKIVGESVELSPVLVIIALAVFGEIFGIWGLVFAVPIFATIKLFFNRIYIRQQKLKNLKESNDLK